MTEPRTAEPAAPLPSDAADTTCPDVLASEYASPRIAAIWSPRTQVVLERRLWLTVLRAQHAEGLRVPDQVFRDYARAVERVDLASIRRREHATRHDLKARIEEFNALAGHQHIHKGLTSCDITDNIAQTRVRMSLRHLRGRAAALSRAAGAETGGAAPGAVLDSAAAALDALLERYPLRGLKGPVGTAQDMLDLLGGDRAALARIEERVAAHLGFPRVLRSVGQLYFRSLDYEVLSSLSEFAARAGSLVPAAPGGGRDTRGPVRSFAVLLRGYTAMAAQLAGEQWNEGDVSCSVVRRIALPGACYAADATLNTVERALGLSRQLDLPRQAVRG
ncbi:adenylosuccinate lyase [Streptomyces albus]|uniref:adenylosuccinate lyase n=1 Tax=Streptomyces albus TaxID=1888 RepID=UPI00345555FE